MVVPLNLHAITQCKSSCINYVHKMYIKCLNRLCTESQAQRPAHIFVRDYLLSGMPYKTTLFGHNIHTHTRHNEIPFSFDYLR